jgi:hypothetical protein
MKQRAVVCGLYEIQAQIDLLAADGYVLNVITPINDSDIIKVILVFVKVLQPVTSN